MWRLGSKRGGDTNGRGQVGEFRKAASSKATEPGGRMLTPFAGTKDWVSVGSKEARPRWLLTGTWGQNYNYVLKREQKTGFSKTCFSPGSTLSEGQGRGLCEAIVHILA